jgi:hypothetical protein
MLVNNEYNIAPGAYLAGAYLSEVNLSRVDLSTANLSDAFLDEANLSGADLRGANLLRTILSNVNLDGANLDGARLDEGVAVGRAIGGYHGGYQWWAIALEGGGVVLHYGTQRQLLSWWLHKGPEVSVFYGHPRRHWAEGPAVAIAAAAALVRS